LTSEGSGTRGKAWSGKKMAGGQWIISKRCEYDLQIKNKGTREQAWMGKCGHQDYWGKNEQARPKVILSSTEATRLERDFRVKKKIWCAKSTVT